MRLTPKSAAHAVRSRCALAAAALGLALAATPAHGVDLSFLYTLSDANGPIPASWVRLAHDPQANETFVLDPSEGMVRVFNQAGMETFSFGDDDAVGSATDIAVLEGGDIVLLTFLRGKATLLRCNFRGEPIGRLEVHGAPAELADFVPDRLRSAGGLLYLANSQAMRVIAITPDGTFVRSYDASRITSGKKARDAGFTGFGVDANGNVLFTVAPLFQAFILAPDGTLRPFGVRGSSPGKFNVVAGIAADAAGNLYLTDVLRSVVMVFSPSFEFLGEVGYRGDEPENLIAPRDLVVGDGQVFVTQSAARGVSVFRIDPSHVAAGS
jgi:hypothetical protein